MAKKYVKGDTIQYTIAYFEKSKKRRTRLLRDRYFRLQVSPVGLQTPSYKARTQQNTIIQKKAAGVRVD